MSDIRGPFSGLGVPLLDALEQHRRLPQPQKSTAGVGMAASSLAWLVYLRDDVPAFVRGFVGGDLADYPLLAAWLPFAVWAGLTGLALLWLVMSWQMAQGPRNAFAAIWRLLLAGVCVVLLQREVWPDDWPFAAWLLKGLYWGWLAAQCARLLLAAHPFGGGSAQRAVNRQLRRNQTVLGRPPRLRRPGVLVAGVVVLLAGAALWLVLR
jgi:hypothetical protein